MFDIGSGGDNRAGDDSPANGASGGDLSALMSGVPALRSGVGELEDLGHVTSMLAKVDWSAHHHDVRLDALADLEMLRQRLDGIAIGLIGNSGMAAAAVNAGHRDVAGFLRSDCHLPRPEASRRNTLSRRVKDRPAMASVLDALIAGHIGFPQAHLIGKYSARHEIAWAFEDAIDTFFLPIAIVEDFKTFEQACMRWYERHDITQGESRDRRNADNQKVRLSPTFEGVGHLTGCLPPVETEIVGNELERLRRILYDQDWQQAKERLGRDPKPDELHRTADQRSVAVMALMAQRSAAHGSGSGALPCVNVLVDYQTFIAATNELIGLPALYPAGGISRTEMGMPISPRTIIETLLAGHIRRVVFGPDGQILDLGRKDRFFTGGIREAVMLRDQTCTVPGCNIPARFCEIDHCTSWHDLGTTSIGNANCLCRFHNGLKGSRSVEPIINDNTGFLAFHRDPETKHLRYRQSPAQQRRPNQQPTPTPSSPRTQTSRNQQ